MYAFVEQWTNVRGQDRVSHSDVYCLSVQEGISGEEIPLVIQRLECCSIYMSPVSSRGFVRIPESSVDPMDPVGRTKGIP